MTWAVHPWNRARVFASKIRSAAEHLHKNMDWTGQKNDVKNFGKNAWNRSGPPHKPDNPATVLQIVKQKLNARTIARLILPAAPAFAKAKPVLHPCHSNINNNRLPPVKPIHYHQTLPVNLLRLRLPSSYSKYITGSS